MAAAQKAMVRVFPKASIIVLLENISSYHFRENPVHFDIVLPSLNESTISVKMGRYKKRSMRARYKPFPKAAALARPFFLVISYSPPLLCRIFQ